MGETIEETIDHHQANWEIKNIINKIKLEKLRKFLIEVKNNQAKINKTKPRSIIKESFLHKIIKYWNI